MPYFYNSSSLPAPCRSNPSAHRAARCCGVSMSELADSAGAKVSGELARYSAAISMSPITCSLFFALLLPSVFPSHGIVLQNKA